MFTIFNGSFINGSIYASSDSTMYLENLEKIVFSLNSTLGNTYLDTKSSNGSFEDVSSNTDSIFLKNKEVKPSKPFGLQMMYM